VCTCEFESVRIIVVVVVVVVSVAVVIVMYTCMLFKAMTVLQIYPQFFVPCQTKINKF